MAIQLLTLHLIVCFLAALSSLIAALAANVEMDSFGTPVKIKDGVTCKFSYDASITLAYCALACLVATNVLGSFFLFYPKREFVPPRVYCFPGAAVIMSGVAATLILSPIIYNDLSQHKVHHDLNYDCPRTTQSGILLIGALLSLIPATFWFLFASVSGCKDFPQDNGVNGDQHVQSHDNVSASLRSSVMDFDSASVPPQVADEIPSVAIDLGHVVDISSPAIGKLQEEEGGGGWENAAGDGSGFSSCAICSVAPLEGACVPCGHVAGCMSCLNKLTKKKWGCPVCRANIDWVMKLYYV